MIISILQSVYCINLGLRKGMYLACIVLLLMTAYKVKFKYI